MVSNLMKDRMHILSEEGLSGFGVILLNDQGSPSIISSAASRLLQLTLAQLGGQEPPPADWRISTVAGQSPCPTEMLHTAARLDSLSDPWFLTVTSGSPPRVRQLVIMKSSIESTLESGRTQVMLLIADVGSQRDQESRLSQLASALRGVSDGILIVMDSKEGKRVTYTNPSVSRLTGYSSSEWIGKSLTRLEGALTEVSWAELFERADQTTGCHQQEVVHYHQNGTHFWNAVSIYPNKSIDGSNNYAVVVIRDVSSERETRHRIEHLLHFDRLTGLPNRHLLEDRLQQAFLQVDRGEGLVAVLHLDINRFRIINDTLGFQMGDVLLGKVGKRLRSTLRDTDTLARLGGDEFIIILPNMRSVKSSARVAEKLQEALRDSFMLEDEHYYVSASIGIAVYPDDAKEPDTLLKRAATALHRVKRTPSERFAFFTPNVDAQVHRSLGIENSLRRAISGDELVLHYQPQFDLQSRRIVGLEALARWFHPDHGMISPGAFIPIAEESGLIVPLGEWALRTACLQCHAWQETGHEALRVAVNLSARQIGQPHFVQMVLGVLSETGLSPDQLELELTESSIFKNLEDTIRVLRALKDAGIHISLDDFGTGYSSLTHLKRFPIDTVKIDQSFVRDWGHQPLDSPDAVIIQSIVNLAHGLKLRVIAEGVETVEQREMLRDMRCFQIQGFLYSRPLPPSELEPLLRASPRS